MSESDDDMIQTASEAGFIFLVFVILYPIAWVAAKLRESMRGER